MTHLPDEDLLALADGEMAEDAAASARTHVAGCTQCARRLTRLTQASTALNASLAARRRRAVRVGVAAVLTVIGAYGLGASDRSPFPRLAAAGLQTPLPLRHFTPGAVRPVTAADLCATPEGPDAGEIPPSVRRIVLRNYGVRDLPDREYELDYLITPALGGAADPQNLWPERYTSPTWNAHVKDELEDLLRRLVCEGALPLASAQRDMATNWIAAYKRYFHTDRPGGWPGTVRRPVPLLD